MPRNAPDVNLPHESADDDRRQISGDGTKKNPATVYAGSPRQDAPHRSRERSPPSRRFPSVSRMRRRTCALCQSSRPIEKITAERSIGAIGVSERGGDTRTEVKVGPPVVESSVVERHDEDDQIESALCDPRDQADRPTAG